MKYWNIHATRMNGKSVTCINQLLDTNQDFIIVRKGTGKEKYEERRRKNNVHVSKKR